MRVRLGGQIQERRDCVSDCSISKSIRRIRGVESTTRIIKVKVMQMTLL